MKFPHFDQGFFDFLKKLTLHDIKINSFENVSPGISPRFFNQNILQNAPLKNIPSTHANATSLVAKLLRLS